MLLSIISVIPGADIPAGVGSGHQGLLAAMAALYTMMWHPRQTEPKPPHSPTTEPQRTLDVYHSAVVVAILKNT